MSDRTTKVEMHKQDPRKRIRNFNEVASGYSASEAMEEAKRCLQCKKSPCVKGCPVEIDIPAFIKCIQGGNFQASIDKIKEKNNLPAVCGRVCPQESQCEIKCVRSKKGESVAIGRLERFAADWEMNESAPKRCGTSSSLAIKVAVVGSGPAGLTAAADLVKLGYEVTVFEALHSSGGVLRYGIPEFRLPKSVLEVEIGRRVGVIGGGNVAMDSARVALRLGAEEVDIIYRRSKKEMPARQEEAENAEEEGVKFHFLTAPLAFLGNKENQLTRVKCIQMKLGEPDESGRRRPIPTKGSEFIMDINTVVVAIGQGANPLLAQTTPDLKLNNRGYIQINEETGQSSIPQIFAGGDIVTGAATVIAAMGAGKKAARGIDEYLNRI